MGNTASILIAKTVSQGSVKTDPRDHASSQMENLHLLGHLCDNALNMPTNFRIACNISPSSRRRDASGRARRRRISSRNARHSAGQTIYSDSINRALGRAEMENWAYRIYWTDLPHRPQLTHLIQYPNDTQRRLRTLSPRMTVCRDKRPMKGNVCERKDMDRHESLCLLLRL